MQQFLNSSLQKYNIDAIYVTDPINIRYLTGFCGSFGAVLVVKGEIALITDDRYLEEAKKTCTGIRIVNVTSPERDKLFESLRIVAYEGNNMTVTRLSKLKTKFTNIKWVEGISFIEQLRREKNAFEITIIQKAVQIGELTLLEVLPQIREGQTEIEIAWKLEHVARNIGAEGVSFPPIVAFEQNSAVPHHDSGKTALQKGDTILIDFGVKFKGYCSDMTRTYFYKEVSPEKEKVYNLVLSAQKLGKKNMIMDKHCSKSYRRVMDFFAEHGLESYFIHSLGHGVGMAVHELPSISAQSKDTFLENDIVTCEPGLYFPGRFGVRIEDIGVIRKVKNGSDLTSIKNTSPSDMVMFQSLSHMPRILEILGK